MGTREQDKRLGILAASRPAGLHNYGSVLEGLPMVAMIRTGSVVPAVIAYYITDLVSLGGVPENWFQFIKY